MHVGEKDFLTDPGFKIMGKTRGTHSKTIFL